MSVDKKTKKFNLILLYPSKILWDFNKREECDNIIKEWHTTFQTLDLKGRNFLNFINNNLLIIESSYTKGGNISVSLIHYVPKLLKPSQIMLL